jgi:hypothetical protein
MFEPTTAPVPHWYVHPVPSIPPVAVRVVLLPLQIGVVPLIPVGAVDRIFTVTVALPVMSAPIAVHLESFKAVIVYVFVLAGVTLITLGDVAIPDIVTGVVPSVYVRLHGCKPVNATDKLVELPLHIVAVPLITEVGLGLTVIIAEPVLSPAIEVQFASLKAVTVYVLVLDGETLIICGEVVIPVIVTGVVPSVYVRLQGCVPVNAIEIFVEPPLQIVVVPLITEVGLGLTVTVALPVLSPACEVQFASLNAVIVYVFVLVGDTVITLGDVAIPVIVTGVVPSE